MYKNILFYYLFIDIFNLILAYVIYVNIEMSNLFNIYGLIHKEMARAKRTGFHV